MKKKHVRVIVVSLYMLSWMLITAAILVWYASIATTWAIGRYQLPDDIPLRAFTLGFMLGLVILAYVLVMLVGSIVQPFLPQKDDHKLPKPLMVIIKVVRGFLVELGMMSVLGFYAYIALVWLANEHSFITTDRAANTTWWLFLFIMALCVYLVMWVTHALLRAFAGEKTIAG
jgi:hypothetical protein